MAPVMSVLVSAANNAAQGAFWIQMSVAAART